MASSETTSSLSPAVDQPLDHVSNNEAPSSQPLEMTQLSQPNPIPATSTIPESSSSEPQNPSGPLQSEPLAASTATSAADNLPSTQNETTDLTSSAGADAPALMRKESTPIGPAQDNPVLSADPASGPMVLITLLLITGARHPYKIDEKYLRRRNVVVDGADVDPFSISVYTMKELIWRDWREEWETRPTSPSYIRLIHFGRLLDDKTPLRDCRFNPTVSNVVHMTVKPQDIAEEEEHAKAGKGGSHRERDDQERQGGICRCVIL